MTGPEKLVGELFTEIAERVNSRSLRPLTTPVRPPFRRTLRWAVPTAAAVGVAAVIAVTSWVGRGHEQAPTNRVVISGSLPIAAPADGSPRFIVSTSGAEVLVHDANTGKTLFTVPPAAGVARFGAVAAARDNRMYFLDAVQNAAKGTHRIYRLILDGQGRPGSFQPLQTSEFTMPLMPALNVSPDGARLMWSNPMLGGLTIFDIRSGHRTSYATVPALAIDPTSDDHIARIIAGKGGAKLLSLPYRGSPTAIPLPSGVVSAAFSPQGSVFAEMLHSGSNETSIVKVTNGQVTATVAHWRETHGMWGGIEIDGSGNHLLFDKNGRLTRLDIATGNMQDVGAAAGKDVSGGVAW